MVETQESFGFGRFLHRILTAKGGVLWMVVQSECESVVL